VLGLALGSECPDTSPEIADIAKTSPSPNIFPKPKELAIPMFLETKQLPHILPVL